MSAPRFGWCFVAETPCAMRARKLRFVPSQNEKFCVNQQFCKWLSGSIKTNGGNAMMNRRRFALGCAVLTGVIASSALLAAEKPPIKIGGSLPLSGFQTPNGTMYRIGITMAIDDVNSAGGVNGSPIS